MNTDGTFSLFKSLFRLGLLHSIYMLFLIRVWRGKRQGENSPPLPYRNFVQHTLLVLTQGGSVKKHRKPFLFWVGKWRKGRNNFSRASGPERAYRCWSKNASRCSNLLSGALFLQCFCFSPPPATEGSVLRCREGERNKSGESRAKEKCLFVIFLSFNRGKGISFSFWVENSSRD